MYKLLPLMLAGLAPFSGLQGKPVERATVPPVHQVVLDRLQDDGILDIRIVIGFMDAPALPGSTEHSVENRAILDQLWRELQKLGFEARYVPSPRDFGIAQDERLPAEELFMAEMPPRSGEGKIRVTVVNSSTLGRVEEIEHDPEVAERQILASARAESFLKEAVRAADVVVYVGHSREGGGPDTYPPQYDAHGHVDYARYRKARAGVALLREGLRARQAPPVVLMSASCSSDCHFGQTLEQLAAERTEGFYFAGTTDVAYFAETAPGVAAMLSGLLDQESPARIAARMHEAMAFNPLTHQKRPSPLFKFRGLPGATAAGSRPR